MFTTRIAHEAWSSLSRTSRPLCSPCLKRIRLAQSAQSAGARAIPQTRIRLQSRFNSSTSSSFRTLSSSSSSLPPSRSENSDSAYTLRDQRYPRDNYSNTPPSILSKLDRQLLHHPSHPLCILRKIIESHFSASSNFTSVTPSSPVVSVYQNFDELGFAADHPGRSLTDSYYLNKDYMLRTHTSAHEIETFKKGLDRWLLSSDVYRRDEIDSSHYPVFHQMEGAHVWSEADFETLPALNAELERQLADCPLIIEDNTSIGPSNPLQASHDPIHAEQIAKHLKHSLNLLIFKLFGGAGGATNREPLKVRWIEAFFPFTTPSYEVEVWFNGEWLELLGCGVIQQKTLIQAGEWGGRCSSRLSSVTIWPNVSMRAPLLHFLSSSPLLSDTYVPPILLPSRSFRLALFITSFFAACVSSPSLFPLLPTSLSPSLPRLIFARPP